MFRSQHPWPVHGLVPDGHPVAISRRIYDTHSGLRHTTFFFFMAFFPGFLYGLKTRGMQQCTKLGHGPRQKSFTGYSIPRSLPSLHSFFFFFFLIRQEEASSKTPFVFGHGGLEHRGHHDHFFPLASISFYEMINDDLTT
jgi:hypothetical protein